MIAVGLVPHTIHILGLFALLVVALLAPPRDPSAAECREARRSAVRVVRDEDAVDDAIAEALPRLRREGGDFVALVVATAKRRKLDAHREAEQAKDACSALAREAREKREAAVHGVEQPEAPDLDSPAAEAACRAATLAECRRRLVDVTGEDGLAWIANVERDESSLSPRRLAEEAAGATAARKLLDALEGAPDHVRSKVECDERALWQYAHLATGETWYTLTAYKFRVLYLGPDGKEHVYGLTAAEAAVLSLLSGNWPARQGVARPGAVIRTETNAIRKAVQARSRPR